MLPAQRLEQRRIRAQPPDEGVPIHLDNHPCVIVGPPELPGHPSMPPSCLPSNVDGVWRQRPSFHALALNSFRSFFHPSIRFPIDDVPHKTVIPSERAATAVVMTNSQPSRSHHTSGCGGRIRSPFAPNQGQLGRAQEQQITPMQRRGVTGAGSGARAATCLIVRVQSCGANLMPSKRAGFGGARFMTSAYG